MAALKLDLGDNPRYVAYARVNGRTPEAQFAQDRLDWPGGNMVGYVLWNRERLVEYSRLAPDAFCFGQIMEHEGYDAWLETLPIGHGVRAAESARPAGP